MNGFYGLRRSKCSYHSGWHRAPWLSERGMSAGFWGRPIYQLFTVGKWVSTPLVIPTEKGGKHRESGTCPQDSWLTQPHCTPPQCWEGAIGTIHTNLSSSTRVGTNSRGCDSLCRDRTSVPYRVGPEKSTGQDWGAQTSHRRRGAPCEACTSLPSAQNSPTGVSRLQAEPPWEPPASYTSSVHLQRDEGVVGLSLSRGCPETSLSQRCLVPPRRFRRMTAIATATTAASYRQARVKSPKQQPWAAKVRALQQWSSQLRD